VRHGAVRRRSALLEGSNHRLIIGRDGSVVQHSRYDRCHFVVWDGVFR
jgi:hypothetical protein